MYLLQVASKRKTDKNAVLKKEEEKEETKVYSIAEKYQYMCANLIIAPRKQCGDVARTRVIHILPA